LILHFVKDKTKNNMKRITEFRKLYGAERSTTLAELKNAYRKLVKEYHPDKFQEEVKIIHLAKFKEYLSAQNLELIEVFGDYQLSPYLEDSSPRLILIARKK